MRSRPGTGDWVGQRELADESVQRLRCGSPGPGAARIWWEVAAVAPLEPAELAAAISQDRAATLTNLRSWLKGDLPANLPESDAVEQVCAAFRDPRHVARTLWTRPGAASTAFDPTPVLLSLPQVTLWLPTVLGANAASAARATRTIAEKIDETVDAHNLDRTQAWEQFWDLTDGWDGTLQQLLGILPTIAA